jgi:hypothetical protein
MVDPMGDLRLDFDRRLMLQFRGSAILVTTPICRCRSRSKARSWPQTCQASGECRLGPIIQGIRGISAETAHLEEEQL